MPPTPDTASALFEALRPRLTAISRRIVGSEAEAQDIVQDCFLKWHDAEHEALAAPAAWLTTVVQHQSIDRLRKRARDAVAARAFMAPLLDTQAAEPEDALLRRAELGQALARMLACLSPAERLVLVLHEVFECGHGDIAATLGTRAANARQHLARARRRLRAQHEAQPGKLAPDEKLCRELVRRFQAAINGRDVPAMASLLADEQPVSVHGSPQTCRHRGGCANDGSYQLLQAA